MERDAPARDRYFAQRISAIIILDHDDLKLTAGFVPDDTVTGQYDTLH